MRYIRLIVIILFIIGAGIKGVAEVNELFFTDKTYPVISSTSDSITVSCDYTDEDLLQGLSATDEKDGDITENILVGEISRFKELGQSEVTYVVFDADGHSSSYTRSVIFSNYRSPRFNLTGALVYREGEGGDVMDNIRGSDVLDGDISGTLSLDSSDVNYYMSGDYTIDVSMYNSFGDQVSINLPVHVLDPDDQDLSIELSQYLVYISAGDSINVGDYYVDVTNSEQESLGSVNVSMDDSSVDTSTPGVYQAKFAASTRDGQTGYTWLTIVVE